MATGGYMGCILEIDLTTRSISKITLSDAQCRRLPGGKTLAAQLLFDHIAGKTSALSEENPLVIATAPLTGSGAPGTGRFDMVSLSPKDDLPAFSNCGSDFGVFLKKAGYDALILTGKCDAPCWLEISDQQVTFRDAGDLWGMTTDTCRNALQKRVAAQRFAALCIGPAGEDGMTCASVLADGHSMGRAGFGAVMGYKGLKAVTVSGQKKIPLADEQAVAEHNRRWYAHLQTQSSGKNGCDRCPLHCPRHDRGTDPLWDALGMDAMEAEAAHQWASAHGLDLPKSTAQKPIGKGRKVSCENLGAVFGLPSDGEETAIFCRRFMEAVSLYGQCIFTVRVAQTQEQALQILQLLESVTGQPVDLETFLALGADSLAWEEKCNKKITSA